MEEFKFLAETIEHVPMQLKDRYMFCCAPIPKQVPFVATMFLKVSAILYLDLNVKARLHIPSESPFLYCLNIALIMQYYSAVYAWC